MVTKMKMFGFFSQNNVVKKSAPAPALASATSLAGPASSALKQFNMASIMKMQSTGCKSCRG
jgi:hypothetical protein